MPIGSGNIRIVSSQSNVTYASNSSNNIVTSANVTSLYSSNINLTDYLVAFEDDGGWSKDVWDASWAEQQKDIDLLRARVKVLEEECAWLNSVGKDK